MLLGAPGVSRTGWADDFRRVSGIEYVVYALLRTHNCTTSISLAEDDNAPNYSHYEGGMSAEEDERWVGWANKVVGMKNLD